MRYTFLTQRALDEHVAPAEVMILVRAGVIGMKIADM